MGQKVNPISLRLGIVENWRSNWFGDKDFSKLLHEDIIIRDYLKKRFSSGTINKLEIEKTPDRIRLIINTAKPGLIIGRKGSEIDNVRDELYRLVNKQIVIDVVEIKNPGLNAQFIADTIALQIEKRTPYRQAIKKSIAMARATGALGIKIRIGGRLAGAEIAQSKQYIDGKVPLHTLRGKIDYATTTCITKSGAIGIKVWVYLGEILTTGKQPETPATTESSQFKKRRRGRNAVDA